MSRDDELHDVGNPYAAPRSPSEWPGVVDRQEVFEGELRPFRTIWTRPRVTIRRIVAENPGLHVVPLACLAGIAETLDRASMKNLGDTMPLAAIIGMACVIGPVVGLLSVWIGSHLIRWSGAWIGGVGRAEHIRAAIAWAAVPSVFALPLWIPEILLAGSEMFTEHTPRLDSQPLLLIALAAMSLVEIVLAVWGFVLLCNTIAEVQGFRSAWQGFANLLLAGVVIIIPIFAIAFIAVLLSQI